MKQRWISVLRGIAILAVVLDHTIYLVSDIGLQWLWPYLGVSVPWFIFLSGITNAQSVQRHQKEYSWAHHIFVWIKRLVSIFIPYVLAVLFSAKISSHASDSFFQIIQALFSFSLHPPYYFILLILELYALFPLLYVISVIFHKRWMQIIILLLLMYVSYGVPFVRIPYPQLSPGFIVGGGYLFVFYLGILYGIHPLKYSTIGTLYYVTHIGITLWVMTRINIPDKFSPLYYLLLHSWSLPLALLLRNFLRRIPNTPFKPFEILGEHSLFIFLFHFPIIFFLYHIWGLTVSSVLFVTIIGIGGSMIFGYTYSALMKKFSIFPRST